MFDKSYCSGMTLGPRYEALLASRRYELVDPAKRHVARELEARWNDALERVPAASVRRSRSHPHHST